jgi:hypothetical protein
MLAETQYTGDEKEANPAVPTKASRNNGQKSTRSWPRTAPSTLTVQPQLEATRQHTLVPTAPRNSPQLPPSPSPATKENTPQLLTDRLYQQGDAPATPDIFRTGNASPQLPVAESHDDDTTQPNTAPQTSIRDRMAAVEQRAKQRSPTGRTSETH